MNPIDEQLNRLFQAARRTRTGQDAPLPYGLETRALAAWRAGQAIPTGFWDMTLLVRGLIVAVLIMAASFWPVLTKPANPYSEDLQLADSTIPADESP